MTSTVPPAGDDGRSGIDRRGAERIALAVEGAVVLAAGVELPCTIHDVSEHGLGISVDPSARRGEGGRLHVRCGDKVWVSFRLPGKPQLFRAGARVCRVWCQDGLVEMGLGMQRISPQALEALAQAGYGADRRTSSRGQRRMARRDLERLLLRVADDVFPGVAATFENAALGGDVTQTGAFFRALVQIEAGKQDIAKRFVALAVPRLVSDYDAGAAPAIPVNWRFDHLVVAAAFCTACDLRESDAVVQKVVEELVIVASFKHLAPPLAAAGL